jgi:hypothetical protein
MTMAEVRVTAVKRFLEEEKVMAHVSTPADASPTWLSNGHVLVLKIPVEARRNGHAL